MARGVASLLVSLTSLPAALALLTAVLWAGSACALPEDDARGRAHFSAGQEYYDQGRYPEAASEFSEAYQLSGRPEMLINRARAEARAGMLEQAVQSLELLFERHPQTSYRDEAEAELTALRAQLPHETPAPANAQPEAAPAPVAKPAPSAPSERAPRLWPPRLPTLIVGSVLVASVLVSVGTGWAAHAKYDALDARCRPASRCPDDGGRSAETRDEGQRLARTSTAFTFLSVALGAATALLWVYDVKAQKARKSQLALGLAASPMGAGAQLRWVH